MGKYAGIPGDYYYSKKVWAVKAQRAAEKKGYKTKVKGSRGYWHLKVYEK